jgi:hypothetical protein
MKRSALIFGFLVAAAGSASAQEDPTGSWADETSAFYFARGGCATDGTYLYYFGGYQLGVSQSYPSYYRRARRYDPAANAWVTLANLPIASSNITYQYNAGAYFDGALYSFGTSWQDGDGIVLRYSIAGDAWSVLDGVALPESRYGAAAAVLGNLIYVSGGYAGAPSRRVDAFDPSTNTFTRIADLPVGLHDHAMVALPARASLCVVGGESADGYEAGCYEYSAASDSWVERASLAAPRSAAAAFAIRNRVYLAGGRSDSGPSAAVFEYHPATDAWAERASMASARYQHGAAAVAGRGYVYGGLPVYDAGEEFTPPDFGPAPELESPVSIHGTQPESSLQAEEDPSERAGWTGYMVRWSAMISDPDPGQLVRLRIRFRRYMEPVWKEIDGGWVGQGLVEIYCSLPTKGEYDWEYRIEDADENSFPAELDAWLPAFGNSASPDLRCDPKPPSAPVGLSPDGSATVHDPEGGEVSFAWTEGADDFPGLVHDVEVYYGSILEASHTASGAGATAWLPVGPGERAWRVRARDLAGNTSPWSEWRRFHVGYDDGLDHAAGDAMETCGFGAGSPGMAAPAAIVPILLAALVRLRRRSH